MFKITIYALLMVLCFPANAEGTLEDLFKDGHVNGQFRSFYINRDWSGSVGDNLTDRSSFAMGGYFRGETGKLNGFSLGAGFYTTNGLGLTKNNPAAIDGTLFDDGKDSYTLLGEAYLKYTGSSSWLKFGRQRLATPMLNGDDARMLPTLFMAYTYENKSYENTTITVSHVNKIAAGTFSNAYSQLGIVNDAITAGGALAIASGYGLNNQSARFMNIGQYTSGQYNDGLYLAGIKHKFSDKFNVQAWNYYSTDLFNTIYLQADYKFLPSSDVKPYISAQYINQSEVGDEHLGKVSGDYIALKAGLGYNNVSGYVAFSTSGTDTSSAVNGGVLSPWAGMPAFTQGMVTRHQFFADTDAFKIVGKYNFIDHGLNMTFAVYYTSFDVGSDNSYVNNVSFKAKESGVDLIFKPVSMKNLSLRFRANFPSDFKPGLDWTEYRFILNYNF